VGTTIGHAEKKTIDCSKDSLAAAVSDPKDLTIEFTGICPGPIVIRTEGLRLQGVGTAVIDGGGQNAITVAGAGRVTLADFDVRNGLNGIIGLNGAHLSLSDVSSHDNLGFGITLQGASSAALSEVSADHNGAHGLDLQAGSAAAVTGNLTASTNRVFGINVNGSSITFSNATVTADGNALGIQIVTGGNAFINDAASVVNANNNLSTGLNVASGAHMVSRGGAINVSGNPVAGVSVHSKAGLDLDAASTLTSANNGDGVLIEDDSVMTVVNIPQVSGAPGFSTVDANHNTGNGVRVLRGSTLTVVSQGRIQSTSNARTGVVGDNGVGLTFVNSTVTGNTVRDIQLTFGTRADLQTLTFGSYTCDATVLVRGSSGITCPH